MLTSLGRKKVVRGTYSGVDNVISRAVVDHHLRPGAGVARIHVASSLGPVLLGRNRLAVRAGVVPAGDGAGVEASSRDARIGAGSLEDIRIRRSKNVGHHGARAEPGEEDTVSVGAVALNGPVHHVDNGMAVGAAVAGVSSVRRDIPAATRVR